MIPIPRKANTIIVLKEGNKSPFEVLLVRRHGKSGFMGGLFVYPGGVVEGQDRSRDLLSRSRPGLTRTPGVDEEEELSNRASCLRELFEEVALLLATDRYGEEPALKEKMVRDRFLQHRNLLTSNKMTFARILEEEGLFLATDRIHYYAHWITPEASPARFDTYFFVALCPDGQTVTPDGREITEARWMIPEDALEANMRGHIALSPPTFRTLEELSQYGSLEGFLASLPTRDLTPILPVVVQIRGLSFIVFPWDKDYKSFRRGEWDHLENPGEPCLPGQGTTRLFFGEGRPIPYRNP
jgi:ADP-ribose pyrophosphatase YjhB (NUDIX family)